MCKDIHYKAKRCYSNIVDIHKKCSFCPLHCYFQSMLYSKNAHFYFSLKALIILTIFPFKPHQKMILACKFNQLRSHSWLDLRQTQINVEHSSLLNCNLQSWNYQNPHYNYEHPSHRPYDPPQTIQLMKIAIFHPISVKICSFQGHF